MSIKLPLLPKPYVPITIFSGSQSNPFIIKFASWYSAGLKGIDFKGFKNSSRTIYTLKQIFTYRKKICLMKIIRESLDL